MLVRMQSSSAIVAVTPVLPDECLAFDHIAVGGSVERRIELSSAAPAVAVGSPRLEEAWMPGVVREEVGR